MINVAINGFGRIGRCIVRAWFEDEKIRQLLNIVRINSPAEAVSSAHLLKYDSIHGVWPYAVNVGDDFILIENQSIQYSREKDLSQLDWSEVDVVLECSGKFKTRAELNVHLNQGAAMVLLSSPGKDVDKTIVYGVNENSMTPKDTILSAASCTTNCLAPILKVIHSHYKIQSGLMTTIHAMTGDQRLVDSSHKDLCRARAAPQSIIPTKTGAASSIGCVIPELDGLIDGLALRVPTLNVSMLDIALKLDEKPSAKDVNTLFENAENVVPKNVLTCNESPLVSTDFNHRKESSIVDLSHTMANGDLLKVMAWYDNEWAFACRMLDIVSHWRNICAHAVAADQCETIEK